MRSALAGVVVASMLSACNCDTGVSVALSPQDAAVALKGPLAFTATVLGTEDPRVRWQVSGPGCDGGGCGTIDQAGHYTGPWCLPEPARVTVIATSVASSAASASAEVALGVEAPGLDGPYAFLFEGVAPGGGPVRELGRFTVDASGAVAGAEDVLQGSALSTGVPLAGTLVHRCYRRATLALGERRFSLALTPDGQRGRFIELDATGGRGVGRLARLPAGPWTLPAGELVLGLSGTDPVAGPVSRSAFLGRLRLDGAGHLEGTVEHDLSGWTLGPATATGTYQLDSATGAGTADFSVTYPGTHAYAFRFQLVSAGEALWLSGLPPQPGRPWWTGRSLARSGELSSLAAVGTEAVLHLVGKHPRTENASAALAVLRLDGDGGVAGGQYDENDDTALRLAEPVSGRYTLDAQGRGTLQLVVGTADAGRELAFQLVSPGRALVIDRSVGDAPGPVGLGELEPRQPGPWTAASLQGASLAGTEAFTTTFTPVLSGVLVLGGDGTADSVVDGSDLFANHPGQALPGGAFALSDAGTALLGPLRLVAVSATRALLLDLDAQQHQPAFIVLER